MRTKCDNSPIMLTALPDTSEALHKCVLWLQSHGLEHPKMQGFLDLDRAGSSGSNDTFLSPLPSLCCLHSQAASSHQQCYLRNLNENARLLNIPREESGCLYALPNHEPTMVPKGRQSSDWPGLGQPGWGKSPLPKYGHGQSGREGVFPWEKSGYHSKGKSEWKLDKENNKWPPIPG